MSFLSMIFLVRFTALVAPLSALECLIPRMGTKGV